MGSELVCVADWWRAGWTGRSGCVGSWDVPRIVPLAQGEEQHHIRFIAGLLIIAFAKPDVGLRVGMVVRAARWTAAQCLVLALAPDFYRPRVKYCRPARPSCMGAAGAGDTCRRCGLSFTQEVVRRRAGPDSSSSIPSPHD